jgi:hypothetical protein
MTLSSGYSDVIAIQFGGFSESPKSRLVIILRLSLFRYRTGIVERERERHYSARKLSSLLLCRVVEVLGRT